MGSFCDQDYLQALLDVEVALAAAEAECGVIPSASVADIKAVARAELFSAVALAADASRDGNVVIPLVRKLTDAVAARNPESARDVHRGATSQDIIDTALALQLRTARTALDNDLTRAMHATAALARSHVATPMAGRTWLQHASPTTFGLKAAGWLDMIGRCRARIGESIDRAQVLQLGGASGTLASLGTAGPAVAESMAKQLGLRVPPAPWHTHRDRTAEVASALGITCGALGKIGRDLTLLAQSEISEAAEHPDGRGGSSSMPHKQNPVRAVTALRSAIQAPGLVSTMLVSMIQEHERAAGGWQAEWQTMSDLTRVTCESVSAIASSLEELNIDSAAMRRHLESRGGIAMAEALVIALLPHLSRNDAMALVERVAREAERSGRTLSDVAAADQAVSQRLSREDIDRSLAPENFLGSAAAFVEQVLQEWGV